MGLSIVLVINIIFTLWYFPTESWFEWGEYPLGSIMTLHDEALWEVIRLIPYNASIITQGSLLPYVTNGLNVHPGWRSDIQFDYIFVDSTHFSYREGPQSPFWLHEVISKKMPEILATGDYGLVTAVDGIWLLKKGLKLNADLENLISPGGHGLFARFYNNSEFAGNPVFQSVFLSLGSMPQEGWWGLSSTDWDVFSPFPTISSDQFTANFSGYVYIPKSGEYSFRSKSYGDITLLIDGRQTMKTGERITTERITDENPILLFGDGQASAWNVTTSGMGQIELTTTVSHTVVAEGSDSLKVEVAKPPLGQQGHNETVLDYFVPFNDWSDMDVLSVLIYGNNSGETHEFYIFSDGKWNRYDVQDNFAGWRNVVLSLRSPDASLGEVDLSAVHTLRFSPGGGLKEGVWYLDTIKLDQVIDSVWLNEGYHKIEVLYTAHAGRAGISLYWLPPEANNWEIVPQENLYLNLPQGR
jgi:hypothetical protein